MQTGVVSSRASRDLDHVANGVDLEASLKQKDYLSNTKGILQTNIKIVN